MTIDRAMKILLVDDSKYIRRAEKKALNKLGFENIIEVEDGNEAIEKLQEEEDLCLIISDWIMPNKDGYELLLWVRADKRYLEIPFIMATARGEKSQVTKAREAGVTDFITKPFGASELEKLIEQVFAPQEGAEKVAPEAARPRKTAAGKLLLNVAHIQITDHLTLGILKHLLATEKLTSQHFELKTVCMPSWSPVQNALEKGEVDVAFILAPIAMDLFNFGVPIRLVLLAHKNGSIFVRRSEDRDRGSLPQFFKDRTFYIPHEMSIHHMLAHMFLRGAGLNPGFHGMGDFDTFFEVAPPIAMPEFLAANPEASGFSVAEPLGTKAIAEGIADLMFLSGKLWENHPCCVVVVRDEIITQHADAVQEFTNLLVQAGQFITQNPKTAAAVGVPFLDPNQTLGLKSAVLEDVLTEPGGIRTDDLFPAIEDFDRIQRYMVDEMGIGGLVDLEKFVDTRFAEIACEGTARQKSVVHDVSRIVTEIADRRASVRTTKRRLNLEGKYLFFTVDDGEYGLSVMGVTEIIEMQTVMPVPWSPAFVRGITSFRGKVIPVIDLRLTLGMAVGEHSKDAYIIVLEVAQETGIAQVGVIVDSVSAVVDIKAEEIEDAASVGVGVDSSYILGLVKAGERIKILLNEEQVLGDVQPPAAV